MPRTKKGITIEEEEFRILLLYFVNDDSAGTITRLAAGLDTEERDVEAGLRSLQELGYITEPCQLTDAGKDFILRTADKINKEPRRNSESSS